MILLVYKYGVSEHNKGKLAMCDDCFCIPTWEIRTQVTENQRTGFACSEHINDVLFNLCRVVKDQDE